MNIFDLLFLILLLLIPCALWFMPSTRKRQTPWIIAFKTAPLGCLMTFFLPGLIGTLLLWFVQAGFIRTGVTEHWGLDLFRFLLAIAVGVMLPLIWVIRITPRGSKPPSGKKVLQVFGLFGILYILYSLICAILYLMNPNLNNEPLTDWRQFPLPAEFGVKLTFEELPVHPFLAEYVYRLRFEKDGQTTLRRLHLNTGGRTHFNLYRLVNGLLFMEDRCNGYIVDASVPEVWLVSPSGKYKVRAPEEPYSGWSWHDETYFQYDSVYLKKIPLAGELDSKVYAGSIRDAFYLPCEMKEEPVSSLKTQNDL